jgi:antitoxin CptB
VDDALEFRKRRARFRAWHRGTREADLMIGGFAERYLDGWGPDELAWFEALLDANEVDVMAWALGRQEPPAALEGPLMSRFRALDFVATAMR